LTGLRASHPGSFDAAHSLRDGTFWQPAGTPVDTRESYNLVVVGGGISGLSAAHFFRKTAGSKARSSSRQSRRLWRTRQRNEFSSGQRTLLGFAELFQSKARHPTARLPKD